jgi:hypothetical protein
MNLGDDIEDAYPLSALQAGMVFHTQLEQFSGLYHDIVTRRLRSPWQPQHFATALVACIAEHPVLRTGCVPLNPFGTGGLSAAAKAYAFGFIRENTDVEQNMLEFVASGDLAEGFGAGALQAARSSSANRVARRRSTPMSTANAPPKAK